MFRAGQAAKLNHCKLIACNCRIVQLAVITDLIDQPTDLVVLLHSFENCLIRRINAEVGSQFIQYMGTKLLPKMLIADFCVFKRHVTEADKKVRILDNLHILHRIQMLLLQMLLKTTCGRARFCCHLCIEEIVPTLQCTLHQRTGIVADTG